MDLRLAYIIGAVVNVVVYVVCNRWSYRQGVKVGIMLAEATHSFINPAFVEDFKREKSKYED